MNTTHSKLRTTLAGVVLAMLGSSLLRAEIDQFPVPASAAANVPADSQPAVIAQVQAQANALYLHLALKLDEADRTCGLTDSQRARLKVAAKGAVEHALGRWIESGGPSVANQQMAQAQQQAVGIQQVLVAMQNQQNQFALQEKQLQLARRALERQIEALGDKDSAKADVAAHKQRMQQNEQQQAALKAQQQAVEAQILQLMQAVAPQPAAVAAPAQAQKIVVGPEAAVREVVAREAAARRQVQQQVDAVQLEVAIEALEVARAGVRPAVNVGMPVSPPNAAAVEQERIWTTAFDGALTAEQKKQLVAAAELRAAFQPKTPAERVVAEMDRLLILDARQRDQLVGLAEKVIASYGNNAAALRNPNLSATSLIAAVKSRLAGDALIGILSETQLAAWTSDLRRPTSPVLRQEGRQDILMPAVPAAPVEMLWQR